MMDEEVSKYLRVASSKKKKDIGAIDFFISVNAMFQDRGSMSAAWIRGVDRLKNLTLKRQLKADWTTTAKIRKAFWDELDEQERDQNLFPQVSHSSSSIHITSSSTSSTPSARAVPSSASSSSSSVNAVSSSTQAIKATKQKSSSLEEPWQTLQDCAQKVSQKRPMPCLEFDLSSMSETRAGLFQHAYDSLLLHQDNGEDIVTLKDAFVALSCTMNLSGPNLKSYFSKEILELADHNTALLNKQNNIANLLEPFHENLCKNDLDISKLLQFTVKRKAELMEAGQDNEVEGKITDIIECLCRFIASPEMRVEELFSESEVVDIWRSIFKILLRDTNIYTKSGETVVIASKGVQEILNKEFGDHSTYGRKADMLFKSKSELCNFEFKAEGTSPSEMLIQNRKNIRLNRCIFEHLRRLGVSRPRIIFADFQGFSGCVFLLQSFKDVYTSKCIDYLSVPQNATELKELLRDGDLIVSLLAIMKHLLDSEQEVNEALDKSKQTSTKRKLLQLYSARDKSPLPKERRFSSSIYLSPSTKSTPPH
ncbi:hypothetical protein BGX27_007925 [Mortierella sp. AM989]|nr:hypothetical protein BGX27_007925 [Mortierella sp. AM989]